LRYEINRKDKIKCIFFVRENSSSMGELTG
jgi:hypothetical protein